jgi:hypothetical protein
MRCFHKIKGSISILKKTHKLNAFRHACKRQKATVGEKARREK